ncbi:MAG: hypothetical protein U5K29_02240 [Acidimicrobiales bacterium]|nr:hypothetical protein [Acidimicrobiales bacterium]
MTRRAGGDELSRRQMLGLVGAGAVAVATGGTVAWRLSRSGDPVSVTSSPSTTTSTTAVATDPDPAAETTTTTDAGPPRFEPYQTIDDEVFTEAKLTGVRVVEALMTYQAATEPTAPVDAALDLAVDGLRPADLLAATEVLFVADTDSAARVVYPQLGGLHPHRNPTSASVMVVVDQHLRRDQVETVVSRCVDVRVVLDGLQWRLAGIEDTSGQPVPAPSELSPDALRVLEHDHIQMPDSIRWDIHEGIVDDRILAEMADLADRTPIAAVTCVRGHPTHVFGTPNLSAHGVGRAVDIWSVGDVAVVQQRHDTDSLAHRVCQDLYDTARIDRLGAPWAFDPVGGWSWTDPVHQDHLHLGVSA